MELFCQHVQGADIKLHRHDRHQDLFQWQIGNGPMMLLGSDRTEALEKIDGAIEVGVIAFKPAEVLKKAIRQHMPELGKNFVVFVGLNDDDLGLWKQVLPAGLREKRFGDEDDACEYIERIAEETSPEKLCLIILRVYAPEDALLLLQVAQEKPIPVIVLAPQQHIMNQRLLHSAAAVVTLWPCNTDACRQAYGIVREKLKR